MIKSIIVLVILILVNAFFAMAEIALISVNETKLKIRKEEGDKKAIRILDVVSNSSDFLSTIQIGISLAGMLSGAFAAQSFADAIIQAVVSSGMNISVDMLNQVLIFVITVIMSFFMLVFGELVPKRVAMTRTEQIADAIIYPISFVAFVAKPFVRILSYSTNLVLRIFKINPDEDLEEKVSEEEFRHIMKQDGSFLDIEKERIDNIFEFDDKTVEDIVTHRKDMIALPLDATRDEIVDVVVNEGFTRIPVFDESIDDIVGILYIRDLFEHMLSSDSKDQEFNLKDILREANFVPVSKKTDALFEEMQKNKVHMSVAVDEYGGTVGIVTMEDLIEEIMGNIEDEFDREEEPDVLRLHDGTFLLQGSALLTDLENELYIDFPDEDYETLGGFIIGLIGRIPDDGEKFIVSFKNYEFEVLSVQDKRIETVNLRKKNEEIEDSIQDKDDVSEDMTEKDK